MCTYCKELDVIEPIVHFDLLDVIDGKGQNFESYMFRDEELDSWVIHVDGVHSQFDIKINYCPLCGVKL